MKKKLFLPLLLITILLSSCTKPVKHDVVTTLFIQYDIVRTIAEDKLTYTMLMPPGVDAHEFEPSSKQIIEIESSKVFFYTSLEMDPWVKKLDKGNSTFIDLSLSNVFESKHVETTIENTHDHDENLHYWTVIENQIGMIDLILAELIKINPLETNFFTDNATTLKNELQDIKTELLNLPDTDTPLYYVGHNIFSLFNEEMHLNIISLTDAFTTEVNPTSNDIMLMINQIKNNQSKIFYFDQFEGLNTATSIESDLKASNYSITKKPLHSMHNVSKDQFNNGITLLDLWKENVINIKLAYEV